MTLAWTAPAGGVTAYVLEAGSSSGLANLANLSTGNALTTFSAGASGEITVIAFTAAGVSGTFSLRLQPMLDSGATQITLLTEACSL